MGTDTRSHSKIITLILKSRIKHDKIKGRKGAEPFKDVQAFHPCLNILRKEVKIMKLYFVIKKLLLAVWIGVLMLAALSHLN
jgi:hypothetical protein